MTNEEKIQRYCSKNFLSYGGITRDAIRRHMLNIAKWKDKQFEDTKDEVKTDAKKELAWEIHKKISEGASISELDNYVCEIVDF